VQQRSLVVTPGAIVADLPALDGGLDLRYSFDERPPGNEVEYLPDLFKLDPVVGGIGFREVVRYVDVRQQLLDESAEVGHSMVILVGPGVEHLALDEMPWSFEARQVAAAPSRTWRNGRHWSPPGRRPRQTDPAARRPGSVGQVQPGTSRAAGFRTNLRQSKVAGACGTGLKGDRAANIGFYCEDADQAC